CGGFGVTDPANLATQVPGNKIISVVYNDYVHPGSVIVSGTPNPDLDTVLISRNSNYIPVEIVDISYVDPAQDETIIYFTARDEYFIGGTSYQVDLTTGITDISANGDCGAVNFSFTADDQPPVPIGSVTPVLATDNIEVWFDEDMCDNAGKCSGAFTATNFTLSNDTDGVTVSGTIIVDNSPTGGYESRAIFDPDLPLPGGKNYTLYLKASVTDLSGNGLDGNDDGSSQGSPADDFSVSFTTENTPPTVTLTSPTDGNTINYAGVSIMVTFSEDVDPASVTGSIVGTDGSFQLTYGAGIQVYGCITVSGNVVTYEPLANLLSGTLYTVTVKGGVGGVTDLGGTPLASDYTFDFYTE
ncbi:MAG: Ig-like domain-containing protein, partial [Deltaproteobacteria bacterium]